MSRYHDMISYWSIFRIRHHRVRTTRTNPESTTRRDIRTRQILARTSVQRSRDHRTRRQFPGKRRLRTTRHFCRKKRSDGMEWRHYDDWPSEKRREKVEKNEKKYDEKMDDWGRTNGRTLRLLSLIKSTWIRFHIWRIFVGIFSEFSRPRTTLPWIIVRFSL